MTDLSTLPRFAESVASLLAEARTLWSSGRWKEARAACAAVAAREDAEALSLLAEMQQAMGEPQEALVSLRKLVRLRPNSASAHRRLGDVLLAGDECAAAEASYREALRHEPANARAHNNLGQALMRLGRHTEAIGSTERAIGLEPGYAIAHNNLGILLCAHAAYAKALEHCERAIRLQPSFAEAHYNRGNALMQLGTTESALASYERALQLRPGGIELLLGRANALQKLGRFEDAVEGYRRVLAVQSERVEALTNLSSALLALRRPQEALECAERALTTQPGLAEAHSNRGGALRQLNQLTEAEHACRRAVELRRDYAEGWSNLANVLIALGRLEQALQCCDEALEIRPGLPDALEHRAGALALLQRTPEAALAYERLFELDPLYRGELVHARLRCCDWRNLAADREAIAQGVASGAPVAHPLILLNLSDSPALQLECSRTFAAAALQGLAPPQRPAIRTGGGRIRVAYLSADFHQHATAVLTAGLFEAHDRSRFEVTAVSYGPNLASPMRERLKGAFERFLDMHQVSDADVVRTLRSLEIDIAVDLKGHTGYNRLGIVARRPAPLQVSYLGYPGTMGLDAIDYILADRIVLPPDHCSHYAEKVVYLPGSYQVNDNRRAIAARTPTRGEAGLPASGFVFCCFNNNFKINPELFDLWMQLLGRIEGSVLWLLEDNAMAAANLRREAALRGVDPARLVFAPRMPTDEHLARHRLADLFLDTLPYNAHTTASDALWAGLPVLTCLGSSFAGRVAASLLHAAGLPELVTTSLSEYAERALVLAADPAELASLRARLAEQRGSCPLFDTERFCRHLEVAYSLMWQRQQAGFAPESFSVPGDRSTKFRGVYGPTAIVIDP